MGAGVPRAGDNIFLFESGSGSTSGAKASQTRSEGKQPAPFRVPCPQTPTSSSSTADTARPTCAADGSAWGSALYGRRNVSGGGWRCVVRLWGRRRLVATGEWRPGVWWHIGRREGGTSSGVERRHQMDYEGSEDGPRASSSSIWEYPKLTTTSRATGAGSLDGG